MRHCASRLLLLVPLRSPHPLRFPARCALAALAFVLAAVAAVSGAGDPPLRGNSTATASLPARGLLFGAVKPDVPAKSVVGALDAEDPGLTPPPAAVRHVLGATRLPERHR
jgi:hypothetical protein